MTSGSIEPWWARWPGLLDRELAELEALGYEPELDEEFRSAHSVIRVKLRVERPDTGETMDLVASYPDLYPYLRPEVQAPDLRLERHQHPFGHNLCLIPRGTRHWDPGLTLARLIHGQLPRLFEAVATAGTDEAAAIEENAGEPFSDYYETWPHASVLIDSSWQLPEHVEDGYLELGYEQVDRIRGAVLAIQDDAGNELASAAPEIRALYEGTSGVAVRRLTMRCRWMRLDAPPDADDARALDQQLSGDSYGLAPHIRAGRMKLRESADPQESVQGTWDVIGLVYPEEVAYRGLGDGWLFLARKLSGGNKSKRLDHRLVKAWRTGPDDVSARVPSTRPLRDRSVLLVGAGAVGAPVALELAKAGLGHLRIWDHDVIDPATSSRWPAGVSSAGVPKVGWLQHTIACEYPYTRVEGLGIRLGSPRFGPMNIDGRETNELELLDDALSEVDLVVDATAEIGVQHALSSLAWERDVDYLCLSTTMGAWGGVVARMRPGRTGCWSCYLRELDGKEPPEDPAGWVQPAGCADATFTGAGFDVQRVSLEAVRLATGTLCSGAPDGYPDPNWDVAILHLRDESGRPTPATWEVTALEPVSGCGSGLHP